MTTGKERFLYCYQKSSAVNDLNLGVTSVCMVCGSTGGGGGGYS